MELTPPEKKSSGGLGRTYPTAAKIPFRRRSELLESADKDTGADGIIL